MTASERQEKFQALIEEHRGILYKICNSYCRNRDDREDLAQEIVVQLWRSFGTFDGRVRFSTWLYRVALNVAISQFRRGKTRAKHISAADQPLLEMAEGMSHEPDEVRLLYGFIEGLDPLNRALVLLYLDGHSYREIGDVLGLSESNVGTKINRLKATMRREIGTDAESTAGSLS